MTTITAQTVTRAALAAAAGIGVVLLPPAAALADPASPSPSAGTSHSTVAVAGTSFLTAADIKPGRAVRVTASTGDFLYWSFDADAGQTASVAATVTLPATAARHGAQTWTIEVFDGLRRRQACTAGAQAPTAAPTQPTVALGCTLREVRSWAEPWSGDPLPGTYYIRLSATDLPEQDLGQTVGVDLRVAASDSGDPAPEGGELAAPLVPAAKAGKVRPAPSPSSPSPSASASDDSWLPDVDMPDLTGWLPDASTRWLWTVTGGILAAVGGVYGFRFTRRPRRRLM